MSPITHLRERLGEERMPVAHPDEHRERGAVLSQRPRQRVRLRARQGVER